MYALNSYQVVEVSGLRSTKYDPHVFYIFAVKPHEKSSSPERNPIGRRTQSDRTANGIRSDGGRNLIGRRTESDRTADANGEKNLGCVSLEMSVEPKINPEVQSFACVIRSACSCFSCTCAVRRGQSRRSRRTAERTKRSRLACRRARRSRLSKPGAEAERYRRG